jgi:hypothetical protein
MDDRKEYEELLRYPIPDETMPVRDRHTEDSLHHHASAGNPTHLEDFTRLVGAAARKREPKD